MATPGLGRGHVSFVRASDRVLVGGDAFATMNMDRWSGLITGKQMLARAGSPFTSDWQAARSSLQELTNLRPSVIGCGHGIPMCDAERPARMQCFYEGCRRATNG